jgi:predicted permease
MRYLLTTINVVLPTCLLVILGVFLSKNVILKANAGSEILNALSYKVLMPCMIFYNIYRSESEVGVHFPLLLLGTAFYILVFMVLVYLVPNFERDNSKRGVIIQGSFHNSFLLIGMSLSRQLYPDLTPMALSILSLVAIPANNLLSVLTLQMFQSEAFEWKKLMANLFKNPSLIACAFAIFEKVVAIPLPVPVVSVVENLAASSVPICLLALGSTLFWDSLRVNYKQIFFSSVVKLLVLPLIFLPLSIYLGFRGITLLALLVLFGSPTAPITYSIAASMNCDTTLAAKIVLSTNCFASVTLSCFIFGLLSCGYL